MVMIWNYHHFQMQNTKFTRNQDTFKNSYLLKNDEEKKCHVLGQLWAIIITSYKKNCSKIHLHKNKILQKKTYSLFLK
jgi:hypothetical protein